MSLSAGTVRPPARCGGILSRKPPLHHLFLILLTFSLILFVWNPVILSENGASVLLPMVSAEKNSATGGAKESSDSSSGVETLQTTVDFISMEPPTPQNVNQKLNHPSTDTSGNSPPSHHTDASSDDDDNEATPSSSGATDPIDINALHVPDEQEQQRSSGTGVVPTSPQNHNETVKVPRSYLKYRLSPKVIGSSKLLVLDAQDLNFYLNRTLKNPILTLWILTKRTTRLSYASKRIFEEAWKMNIQVIFVDTQKLDMIVTQDGLEHILYRGMKVKLPDCVYPRLGASVDYFGMAVIRQLEKNGVLVLNPTLSIEISRDKLYSLQHLAAHNLPIPKTMITKLIPLTDSTVEGIEREFTYPIVLKKSHGSQGKGVILVENRQTLKDIVDMLDSSKPLIFQEYISRSKGRDIRVFIVGGKAIGAMMRIATKGFKSNFHQGGYVKRVKLAPAVEWLAIEGARLVGLDIAGVDILIDKDTYKICEINASPGFEGFELATGVNVPKKLLEFAALRVGVWNKKKRKKPKRKILVPIQAEHILRPSKEEANSNQSANISPQKD